MPKHHSTPLSHVAICALSILLLSNLPSTAAAKTFTVGTTDTKQSPQIKVSGEWKRSSTKSQWKAPSVEFATPITSRWDVAIKGVYQTVQPRHGKTERGFGDVELKSKINFYQHGRLNVATKPEITLPTGNHHRGLGNGYPDYTLPVFMNYRIDRWRFGSEVGYTYRHHNHQKSAYAALLASYQIKAPLEAGVGFVSQSKEGKTHHLFQQVETGFNWKLANHWSIKGLLTYTLNKPANAQRDNQLKLKIEKVFK